IVAQAAAEEHSRSRLTSASLQANAPTTQRNVIYGRGREDAPEAQQAANEGGGLLNDPGEIAQVEKYRAELEQELMTEREQEEARLIAEEEAAAQTEAAQAQAENRRAQEP